ncbi:hypothetical protein Pmani_033309 [Petrolisthes manimaculis]|uniref:Uncharacterized protein n=1 Tax=Petrolisthes manimaculis TaxID=1843537 RepID=A0AAE1NPR2_9EUCA|nr:hypothetical protein Pmani_033309 [Petrolisthes manimaculis]
MWDWVGAYGAEWGGAGFMVCGAGRGQVGTARSHHSGRAEVVVTVCLGWARRGRLIVLQGGCPLIFAPTSANQHHQDINSVAPAVGLPPRK